MIVTPIAVTVIAITYLAYRMINKAIEIFNRPYNAEPPRDERARRLLIQRSDMLEGKSVFAGENDHFAWLEAAKKHIKQP